MSELRPESALADIALHLQRRGRPFALVGGLAVSLRAEVRFTPSGIVVDLLGATKATPLPRTVTPVHTCVVAQVHPRS